MRRERHGDPGFFVSLCAVLAAPLTLVRYAGLWWRGPAPRRLRRSGFGSGLAVVHRISFARLMRRLLKHGVHTLPGFRAPSVVVEGRPESLHGGCVVAFLHCPWDELLIRELHARWPCLVLADDVWAGSLGRFHAGSGPARLRRAITFLRGGGRVAVVLDDFDGAKLLPARFFDVSVRVSTGVPRLASGAGVPVVPVAAAFRRGRVRLQVGPRISVGRSPEEQAGTVHELIRFFEPLVRRSPESYGRLLAFLRRAGG